MKKKFLVVNGECFPANSDENCIHRRSVLRGLKPEEVSQIPIVELDYDLPLPEGFRRCAWQCKQGVWCDDGLPR